MEKAEFEKYPYLCRQIERLSQPVTDTVQGSASEPPYQLRTYSIHGATKSALVEKLKAEKEAIEKWIEGKSPEEQELLLAVSKHGTRWNVVRRDIGTWRSPDAVRKQYERIFHK